MDNESINDAIAGLWPCAWEAAATREKRLERAIVYESHCGTGDRKCCIYCGSRIRLNGDIVLWNPHLSDDDKHYARAARERLLFCSDLCKRLYDTEPEYLEFVGPCPPYYSNNLPDSEYFGDSKWNSQA